MKDLQPNILDDYEHRINRLIETHQGEEGFPRMETYHISRQDLDDYLFDYQAVLDSEGSARTQQTVYGLIVVVPVVVISAFPLSSLPWKSDFMSLMVGLLIGLSIALVIKVLRVAIKRAKLHRLRVDNPDIAGYVDAVVQYEK
ncbi:MAG: hypothetical protein I3J02_05690 [Prevotella sp.]|nr:hypothetical protein [Prevotella sp.]